jgi:hypothetical protein
VSWSSRVPLWQQSATKVNFTPGLLSSGFSSTRRSSSQMTFMSVGQIASSLPSAQCSSNRRRREHVIHTQDCLSFVLSLVISNTGLLQHTARRMDGQLNRAAVLP